MITPGLEKLILSGYAEYRTYSFGASGVGTIPINENSEYMVVTDFIWNPFHDLAIGGASNDSRTIHTLRLYNGKKACHWNFRDTFIPNSGFFNPANQIKCYYLSKQDIAVNIFNFSAFKVGDFNYALVNLETEEIPAPYAYGNQLATLSVSSQAGARINCLGLERNPNETPASGAQRNEFFDNINASTRLGNGDNLPHWGIPLVTFGIVQVNKIPSNYTR